MSKIRVHILTTAGPVEVQSVVAEDAPIPSVVCLDGTTRPLPLSQEYAHFVKRGSGVVERITGHGAYRMDVSHEITSGRSWQLGFFTAHMLQMNGMLAHRGEAADRHLFISGEVDGHYGVRSVDHIPEKLRLAIAAMREAKNPELWLPSENAQEAETLGLPSVALGTAHDVFPLIGCAFPEGLPESSLVSSPLSANGAGVDRAGGSRTSVGKDDTLQGTQPLRSSVRSSTKSLRPVMVSAVFLILVAGGAYALRDQLGFSTEQPSPIVSNPGDVSSETNTDAVTSQKRDVVRGDKSAQPTVVVQTTPTTQEHTVQDQVVSARRDDLDKATEDKVTKGKATEVETKAGEAKVGEAKVEEAIEEPSIELPPQETVVSIPDVTPNTVSDGLDHVSATPIPRPTGSDLARLEDSLSDVRSPSAPAPKVSIEPTARVTVTELRPVAGSTCANIKFQNQTPREVVARQSGNSLGETQADGLCGLKYGVTAQSSSRHLFTFLVTDGRRAPYLMRPWRELNAQQPRKNMVHWQVDIPSRRIPPVGYHIVAMERETPFDTAFLRNVRDMMRSGLKPGSDLFQKAMADDGVAVTVIRHGLR